MFAIIGFLYFLVCLHRVSPTVIARDLAQSFAADAVILGIISSSYFFTYSAVQPLVGILSDTVGPRKVITTFSLIAAIGAFIFATAPSALIATMGRALVGAGVGGVFIPSLKIFSQWYRANEFASLTGIMIAIGGIGGLSAALPLTYLVVLLGWRASFVSLGVLSIILATTCWIIVKDSPQEKGWPAVIIDDPETKIDTEATSNSAGLWKRLAMVFGSLNFWMIVLATFFTGGVFLTFQGLWAVPYLMDVFGMNRVRAGWFLMLLPFGFAVGGPAFGFLTDRLSLNRKYVLLGALGLGVLGWIIMLFLNKNSSPLFLIPLFLIFGAGAGGCLPIYFTVTKELFPPWLMGTAVGLMNPAAFLGAALYQPFSGFLLNKLSTADSVVYPLESYRTLLIVFLLSFIAAYIATALLSNPKGWKRQR